MTIYQGKDFQKRVKLSCDIVIIGSGCGGAVVAKELAEEGYQVVIVEEGGYYQREEYSQFTPSDTLRFMYRDYGGTPAVGVGDSPLILIQAGRCVGGSSIVNGGVCFRTPDYVIEYWQKDLELPSFDLKTMESIFERVEKECQVQRVDEKLHNKGVLKLKAAAEKLGYSGRTIDRNVVDCEGCCRCIFCCPEDHKKSVLTTYLEKAQNRETVIYSDFRVDRILTRGNKVQGIKGTVLDRKTGRGLFPFEIKAKIVVLSAGSLASPIILLKNKLGRSSKQVGRNLTLHPGARVYGIFEDTIEAWKGAFQSYVIDHFGKEGIKLISIFPPTGVIAATLPGFRWDNWEHMKNFPHLSAFGVMISDLPGGRVRNAFGVLPLVTYRMASEDKAKLVNGVLRLADLYFEAGAKKVYLPFKKIPMVESRDDLKKITPESIPGKWIESGSQHPMGTCKMGRDPGGSVVNEHGESHAIQNLFVADGSAIPTSVAVNPQITIMAIATKIADYIKERARTYLQKI